MKKVNKTSLNVVIVLAFMVAISIVSCRFLSLRPAPYLRLGFENLSIIFSGIAFGPIAGAVVAVIADFIGCLIEGNPINPIITLGAATIGAVAGVTPALLRKFHLKPFIVVTLTVFASHFLGSVIIKSIGLSWIFGDTSYFVIMIVRFIAYAIVGAVESVALDTLLKSRGISMQLKKLKEQKK